jgi:hypothetical protein
MSLARGEGRQTRNLAEVVKDALEDEGGGDDDGAYGGHGPRRRLVQRPRAVRRRLRRPLLLNLPCARSALMVRRWG